jgi:phosphate:Na+ symporter
MSPEKLDVLQIVFGLLGGLAIFIFGMNFMSDGLQKTAGDRMRRILEILTGNPLIGVLVGAGVTAIIQSSGATTVMVIGFVSAGLMSLTQAIGVIMGANIGTTITAQLIAFKIGNFAYLIAAAGFILYFFFKKKRIKYLGQTIFGFGILFIGINTMSEVMSPLAKSPSFANIIVTLGKHPVLGVIVGAVLTVLVQSSSAIIAVLQKLASQTGPDGVHAAVSLGTALPLLFGSNIGSTITAILASIGAKLNAKRAAIAHSIFNIVGTLIFIWLIPSYAKFIEFISPKGAEVGVIARQIANAHTVFNVINTLIWLPFIWVLAKIVTFFVRGKEEEEDLEKRAIYLDYKMLGNPAIAMDLATKEFSRMGQFAKKAMESARNAFIKSDRKEIEKVLDIEDIIDMLQYEIVKYLSTMLSQSTLTERQSVRLAGLMHVAGDIERIGDQCENIAGFAQFKIDERLSFSQAAIAEVSDAFDRVTEMVAESITCLREGDTNLARKVIAKESDMDELESRLRERHIERLNTGLCNPQTGITFVELLHNLERITDHCKNIAEAVLDDYGWNSKSNGSTAK